ncbi:hypothetical protein BHE74_00016330 [Ensete ventricosum]|nr:hypothetical protein GW17_00055153 [Ensete ventricosum]RWW75627.1 hypothetical protein BHE74_00016330 [Ensete ventricosum]RZS09347.1 hypothetical protein BHM03_00040418 [Ensete ventricosum]
MLHQCGHQSGSRPCSCGSTLFSVAFPVTGRQSTDEDHDVARSCCSSPSSVDCTLSLGTPSTRQTENNAAALSTLFQRPSCVSSFGQDIISQSKKKSNAFYGGATNGSNLGGDPLLLVRRCANCDTTSTPLWRNGPRGPKVRRLAGFTNTIREACGGVNGATFVVVAGDIGSRGETAAVTLELLRFVRNERQLTHHHVRRRDGGPCGRVLPHLAVRRRAFASVLGPKQAQPISIPLDALAAALSSILSPRVSSL